ncbi:MAG: trypsin-like peptidase domain-containing protein [Candidatus Bathyarchaeota archaeon]|nr:trypsin-like peptidase domain-containing protein [Candidatus Bathyarchaeota archaeon]
MESSQADRAPRFSTALLVMIIAVSLTAGGLLGCLITGSAISANFNDLQGQLLTLQGQLDALQSGQNIATQSNTYVAGENGSLAQLYAKVKDSVVVIQGLTVQYDVFRRPYYSEVQGSGFIYNFNGQMVTITNYHVVQNTINITVTFINGNGYAATLLGSDPYADLAVLSTEAPQSECKPLEMVSSSTLSVGDALIAVGGPYGLAGTMTTGIVSALGRTITEDMSGGYPIANVIQMSVPINPGNSGGPLLNYQGQVVGITTAIVSESQGVGFAIPSSTVLREIESLVTTGSYDKHPTIGASGTDMTYGIAKAMGVDVTYGWLIAQVTTGGPAASAGLHGGTRQVTVGGQSVVVGGDIIIAINGARIRGIDDLSSYLEENTLPGQTITVTIVRDGATMNVSLKLGTRPAAT